jgi:hypothetical protein
LYVLNGGGEEVDGVQFGQPHSDFVNFTDI